MDYKGKSVLILLRNKTILSYKIEEGFIAQGNESVIYRFQNKEEGNTSTYILKLYSSLGYAAKNYAKVKCMFNHPIQSSNANVRFCWPIGLVYDKRTTQFYGFAMEEVFPDSRSLDVLGSCLDKNTISEWLPCDKKWHRIYELDTKRGLRNRLVILYKWAVSIKELQERGNIVMGDIKPSNVMCTTDGKISIVDIDSMQYTYYRYNFKEEKWEEHTYISMADSPRYCHPDVQKDKAKLFHLTSAFDVFSMAVSFYFILAGAGSKWNADSLDNLHSNHERLSENLNNLFERSFTSKLEDEPTMEEWCKALKNEIISIEKIGKE